MTSEELIRQSDLQKISDLGQRIYEEIKGRYEPGDNGKFLAIETDTKKAYIGSTSAEAVETAKKENPLKVFYVVKIGHSVAETLAALARA